MFVGAPDNCTDGKLRLISGQSSLEGTVQICAFGYWGTICDLSWNSRDAYVVCKQLGYPTHGNKTLLPTITCINITPLWHVHARG